MKTKILKSVLSIVLALTLVLGSGLGLSKSREARPQCILDSVDMLQ